MDLKYEKFRSYFSKVYKYNSFSKQLRLCLCISFALIIIDNRNLLSKIFLVEGESVFIVGMLMLLIYLILQLSELGIKDAFYMKSTNVLDICVINLILLTIVYGGAIIFIKEVSSYKLWAIILMDLFFIYIIWRRVNITTEIENKTIGNIITLKQLFEDDFVRESQEPILLKDEEANYDLLGRNQIINYIYQAVKKIKTDKRFVISLEGKWGSGKSTILNGVKEKLKEDKNTVILDAFDPSLYNDKTVMLENMFGYLMKRSGIKFNTLDLRKTIKEFPKLFFKSEGVTNFFLKSESIENIRVQINDFLKASGKKYVFIIDNIDRVDNENILSVFKFVSSVLNFDNVIYILSFDNEKVKKAFETDSGVDYSYLKKIINLPIRIPEIQTERLQNVYKVSLKNICRAYNQEKLSEELDGYVEFLCKGNVDLRDFSRLINGPINYVLSENCFLNRKELLILETVKVTDFELYRKIYLNKALVISKNLPPDFSINIGFDIDSREAKINSFFREESKNHGEYFKLLSEVFPYVEEYVINDEVKLVRGPKDIEAFTERSACSWKYFDLYFGQTTNHYIEIETYVDNFIDEMNMSPVVDLEKSKALKKLFENKEWLYQKEFLEKMLYTIDKINSKMLVSLAKFIINNNSKLSFQRFSLFSSPWQRGAMIVAELFTRISEQEVEAILSLEQNNYKNLAFWQEVFWNYERSSKEIGNTGKIRLNYFLESLVEEVLKSNLDIYDNKNYFYHNVMVLTTYCAQNPERLINFINNILNEKNVYRFLYDIIGISFSFNKDFDIDYNKINYRFEPRAFERFTTIDNIQKLLLMRPPVSEGEVFIAEVFKRYTESDGKLMEKLVQDKLFFDEL